MKHFNGLTPAQAERLAMLAEECGEVIQVIGKILRHGYESRHPNGGHTNRVLLDIEMIDLEAVRQMMLAASDAAPVGYLTLKDAMVKKLRFSHHQQGEQP